MIANGRETNFLPILGGENAIEYFIDNAHTSLERYDGPKGVVVDLGAHVGTFSCIAAVEYDMESVVAVEAHPDNYSDLHANIVANSLTGTVVPLPFAVASRSYRTVNIGSLPVIDGEGYTGQRSTKFREDFPGVSVRTICLQDLLMPIMSEMKLVDLLKIDIEGSEWEVFDDRIKWLLDRVRYVDLELHPLDNPDYFDVHPTNINDILDVFSDFKLEEVNKLSYCGYRSSV